MLYMHYFTLSVDRGSDLYQEIAYHFNTITASMIKTWAGGGLYIWKCEYLYANWPQRKQRNVIVNAYHVTLT